MEIFDAFENGKFLVRKSVKELPFWINQMTKDILLIDLIILEIYSNYCSMLLDVLLGVGL